VAHFPESAVNPAGAGPEVAVMQRVRSEDYGPGTIVADLGAIGIQVLWDQPKGTVGPSLMLHDRIYVQRLERI
jgi:hypothetical protein